MSEHLYLKIQAYLEELIQANQNVPNYKLPSENQLAQRFGASRLSAGNAMKSLEKMGYIERIQGKGTFIKSGLSFPETQKRMTVILLTPNTKTRYINEIIDGMQDFCAEHRMNLFLSITDNDVRRESSQLAAIDQVCKGVVVFPADCEAHNEQILKLYLSKFPLVLIDRTFPQINISSVVTDNRKAMSTLIRQLSAKYQKITYITPRGTYCSTVNDRISSFETNMLKYQKAIYPENIYYIRNYNYPDLEKNLHSFLEKYRPEVILINSDNVAFSLLKVTKAMGIQIPEDLKLVLFDDEISDYTEFLNIKPWVVLQDAYRIGYRAMEMLRAQINGNIKLINEEIPAQIILPQ